MSDCTFLVRAYVDARNGFGAMIRSTCSLHMERRPDRRTWQLLAIDIAS